MAFSPEQLNFFKLVIVMFDVEEFLQSWKDQLLDPLKALQYFGGAKFCQGISPTKNGVKKASHNGISKSCQEQNHKDLHDVVRKKVYRDKLLNELSVEVLPNGKCPDHVQSTLRNIALAEDQVHLLRNKLCFEFKSEMIEEDTFVILIKRTKDSLNGLDPDTSRIDSIVKMGEEDFTTGEVQRLRNELDKERNCEQFKDGNHFSNKVKSDNDSSSSQCTDEEQLKKSLLSSSSEVSSLSLVSQSPCDAMRTTTEYSLGWWSPSLSEEKASKLKENTYQEGYASTRPLLESSTKLRAEFHGESSNGDGLLSEEGQDTNILAVEHRVQQKDQEFKQSNQQNCMCACCQSYDNVVSQLKDEIVFYQDRCFRQEDEIIQLKETLSRIEKEKQGLEAEVGRQLFLEGKQKRHQRIYPSFTGHGDEQITLNTARGASFNVDGEELDTPGSPNNSGHLLQYIIQEISDLLSKSEIERIKILVTPKVDLDRLARIRKGSELFKELEYKRELSCSYVKCLLEKIHRSDLAEKLVAPFYESDELMERESYSPQERNQGHEASERTCVVDSRTSDEMGEIGVTSRSALIDEEFHVVNPSGRNFCDSDGRRGSSCNPSNSDSLSSLVDINCADSSSGRCGLASSSSQSTSSSAVYVESLMEDSHCGAPKISLNSEHALKVWENSDESTFDTTGSGDERQERSVSLSPVDESFESGEVKEWGAAKVEGGKEDLNSFSSICDGAVNRSYLIQQCNTVDVVDGPCCTSSRAQDSFEPKNVFGLNQDSPSPESMPQKQDVSHAPISTQKGAVHVLSDSCASNQVNTWEHVGARPKDATQKQNVLYATITTRKDSAADQSDYYVRNQLHEWEHLGARPRDRTWKGDGTSDSSSLSSMLFDLVPQQVGGPVVQGVVNTFLARHSEDKHLHESLYYNNAEEMLAKDMDSMMNMIDSNKAKPYLGDCQVVTKSDPIYQPYSSIFPLNGEAYTRVNGEDGLPLSDTFNGNYLPPPGPSYSCIGADTSQNSNFNSFDPTVSAGDFSVDTRESQLLLDGHFTSLQRGDFLQPGFTSSGLTSVSSGFIGPQMTYSVIGTQSNFDFTGTTSILPPEPLQMQRSSTTNLKLLASQNYGNQPNASTNFPTLSPMTMANGSNSKLLSGSESGRNTHLSPVSSTGNRVNTSGQRNSSSILHTVGDHLASGTLREGNSADASSSSGLTSGATTGGDHDQRFGQSGGSVSNGNYGTESAESTDNSLLELEQRVEEACAMVERVLKEREEREEFGKEIERKEREIRAERARKKREREARELEEARGWPQHQEPVTGQSLWLCEHYQRHCRVRFPCCTNFYSCHRCHNNSKECDNEEAKASHATHLKCNYCHHEQEIAEDSAKCRSCGAKMSAYFCGICKHFTSIDKNPYHCDKCGICRIHKDKSFHCDVCNVCLDKRLQGKHKCRPDSGHDECCICLEDAFSGCQILPCSHKVHRECAIAMIQNGIRTCPVCRHPLYSPAPE